MKKNLFVIALLGLGVFAVGCGGNDCEDAADRMAAKFDECGIPTTNNGESSGEEAECTEQAGKDAQALADKLEAASCDDVKSGAWVTK